MRNFKLEKSNMKVITNLHLEKYNKITINNIDIYIIFDENVEKYEKKGIYGDIVIRINPEYPMFIWGNKDVDKIVVYSSLLFYEYDYEKCLYICDFEKKEKFVMKENEKYYIVSANGVKEIIHPEIPEELDSINEIKI